MKWLFIFYCAVSLAGCQNHLFVSEPKKKPAVLFVPVVNQLEQTMRYAARFNAEYNLKPTETCIKYKQLFQQGDWLAGWVLALHVNEIGVKPCINYKDMRLILSMLESEKIVDSELVWISEYHLRLLRKLQLKTKKLSKLIRSTRSYKQQIIDLKKINQQQLEKLEKLISKLEALKEIATSIHNDD